MAENPAIDKIRRATKGTPYEGLLFLVGGIVRDKVMGRLVSDDVDIVLEGDALKLADFLHDMGATDHRPVVYPRFGTAMIAMDTHTVELVSARRESYKPASRKPQVKLAKLRDDVLRRDFTINTLMENLHTGEVLDLTGRGMADIEVKIIRTPTEPQTTFYDDPLRMLRAVRFAVRLQFEIEKETWDAIVRDAERLQIISHERIRDEFIKVMMSEHATQGLRMLADAGLLGQFAPELLQMSGVTQSGGHIYDVWEHTLHALDALPPDADLVLRLATLLHDVGKPSTKSVAAEGESHFYGHERLSAETASRILRRLKFPAAFSARVARLTAMHMRVGEYNTKWGDPAVKRLMRDAGEDMGDLMLLAEADRIGANPKASLDGLRDLEQRIDEAQLGLPPSPFDSPLDGREIMDLLGITEGAKIGEIKEYLMDEILDGRIAPQDKQSARSAVLRAFGKAKNP